MAGYTAYTDAQELTAMRGTHRSAFVTTTNTSSPVCVVPTDSDESENAAGASILTVVRQVRENV
jgi:hypothetical protein